jgi:hypothetical protein
MKEMNPDWDVVATQSNSEVKESKMRSKAMLIIARKGSSYQTWNRVIKRFIGCIRGNQTGSSNDRSSSV